jgi:hypothetical protein
MLSIRRGAFALAALLMTVPAARAGDPADPRGHARGSASPDGDTMTLKASPAEDATGQEVFFRRGAFRRGFATGYAAASCYGGNGGGCFGYTGGFGYSGSCYGGTGYDASSYAFSGYGCSGCFGYPSSGYGCTGYTVSGISVPSYGCSGCYGSPTTVSGAPGYASPTYAAPSYPQAAGNTISPSYPAPSYGAQGGGSSGPAAPPPPQASSGVTVPPVRSAAPAGLVERAAVGRPVAAPALARLPAPTPSEPPAAPPERPPSYRYDGGPANPVPLPDGTTPVPMGDPSPPPVRTPAANRVHAAPAKATFAYAAYGETPPAPRPATDGHPVLVRNPGRE